MASCTKCGANLVSMARFCARCGSAVVSRSSVPPTTDMPVDALPGAPAAPSRQDPAPSREASEVRRAEPSGPRPDPFAKTVLGEAPDPVIRDAMSAGVSPMAASIMSTGEPHRASSPPMYGRASSLPTPSPGYPAPQPAQPTRPSASAPRPPPGAPPGYISTPWNVAPVPPAPSVPPPPPGPTQYAAPLPMASHSFMPGAVVLVYWADGNRYHGTVVQVSPHHVFVVFPNGAQQWIDARYVTSGG